MARASTTAGEPEVTKTPKRGGMTGRDQEGVAEGEELELLGEEEELWLEEECEEVEEGAEARGSALQGEPLGGCEEHGVWWLGLKECELWA